MEALDTLLSYSLDDLLLFSPEAYWQLLADTVLAQSPALPLLAIATLTALAGLYQPRLHTVGLIAQGLLWLFCGWKFYGQHYASLNPLLAPILAYLCYAQASLALALATRQSLACGISGIPDNAKVNGLPLLTAAVGLLLVKPMLAGPELVNWVQQLPGLLPLPTALFSLLLACGLPKPARWLLLPLALLVLTVECLTLKLLGSEQWWHNALWALLVLLLACWLALNRQPTAREQADAC